MTRIALAAALTLGLAACGVTPQDRALTGAGLGAAGGGLVGGLAGDPLTGALVGGAVGGIGGAATDHRQVDLGRPLWR